MAKSIGTLIRLARFDLDKISRHLAEKMNEIRGLEEEKQHLIKRMADEQAFCATADDAVGLSYGRFAAYVSERRDALDDLIDRAEQQAATIQEALAAAFRTLKTYEESQRLRDESEQAEAARKDRIELDEIGLMTHRRKTR